MITQILISGVNIPFYVVPQPYNFPRRGLVSILELWFAQRDVLYIEKVIDIEKKIHRPLIFRLTMASHLLYSICQSLFAERVCP